MHQPPGGLRTDRSAPVAPSAVVPASVHDAEPIPEAARAEIDALLTQRRPFPLHAPRATPVALLEDGSLPSFMGVPLRAGGVVLFGGAVPVAEGARPAAVAPAS